MHMIKMHTGGSKANYRNVTSEIMRQLDYYKNNVDHNKSHLNAIIKPYLSQEQLEQHLQAQGIKSHRKDAVMAAEFVCSLPKDEQSVAVDDPSSIKEWANEVISATCQSLGLSQDDVIGAVVHLDETTPHVHFGIMPITHDEQGKAHLRAKFIDRERLKSLHPDVQAHMSQIGYTGLYVAEAEAERGMGKSTLAQYKQEQELNKHIEQQRDDLLGEIGDSQELIKQCDVAISKRKDILDKQVEQYNHNNEALNWQVEQSKQLERELTDGSVRSLYDAIDAIIGLDAGTSFKVATLTKEIRDSQWSSMHITSFLQDFVENMRLVIDGDLEILQSRKRKRERSLDLSDDLEL